MKKEAKDIIVLDNTSANDANRTRLNVSEKKAVLPEGQIQLIDGSVIDGYPKAVPCTSSADTPQLTLDATSEFLATKKHPEHPQEVSPAEKEKEEQELFFKNAFFLWTMKERILADSRIFLARVPVRSGIAYTGESGFRDVTLGVYIEWWQHCKEANFTDQHGMRHLVCRVAGSPLSGSNICLVAQPDDSYTYAHLKTFLPVWSSLIDINVRYTGAKKQFQAYTLKEVLQILKSENVLLNGSNG